MMRCATMINLAPITNNRTFVLTERVDNLLARADSNAHRTTHNAQRTTLAPCADQTQR